MRGHQTPSFFFASAQWFGLTFFFFFPTQVPTSRGPRTSEPSSPLPIPSYREHVNQERFQRRPWHAPQHKLQIPGAPRRRRKMLVIGKKEEREKKGEKQISVIQKGQRAKRPFLQGTETNESSTCCFRNTLPCFERIPMSSGEVVSTGSFALNETPSRR